ncbi:DUF4352 domain-containing protein [Oceanobacillus massiliensis]|uniref:DUF4352 domain-containing protein n=1 Tax=Oceanobacillus massiliensis TaxID=1465765 RepID=UPI0002889CD4|nr:DUF4352 domain-containing protein [Oceanobacillus massiliensis]
MRKIMLAIMAAALLAGCNVNNESKGESRGGNNQVQAASLQNGDKYTNNPQAPATDTLKEIDQSFGDEDGEVILKALSDHKSAHTLGPIELTIDEVKVMNYIPANHLIDYFHGFTHNETNFNYVKLKVTVKNNASQTVDFAPVSILETNEGEMKDFEDDFYLQSLHGQLKQQEEKSGELAFIIDKTDPENLSNINITTSDVFNMEEEPLAEGETIQIEF